MKTLRLGLLGASCLLLLSSGAWAWQTNINGTANNDDNATAVAVDARGNAVAAGVTINTDALYDFTVVKFDGATGAELWREAIKGTANNNDVASAVTVDARGNVVAAGITENTGTLYDFTVVKFDGATGAELWRQVIDGTANGLDEARAVTVDARGDVVAAGITVNTGTLYDFTVVKFDGATGAELWRQVIDGPADDDDTFDRALAVTVDARGNVVAAGVTVNAGTSGDFTVVKFDGATGAELWRQAINGTANSFDEAHAVTVDARGNVVAAGRTVNSGTLGDFTVVKFDGATGAELWRQVINGTANGSDVATAVTVDAGGNVVAAGVTENAGTLFDFTVVKFDGATGAELWRQVINGTANNTDAALAITVHARGDVVAAGLTRNTGFTVVKFDRATGAELWRRVINGIAYAVTVDARGDVVAAGLTRNTGTSADFTVVKLRGIDGGDF